MGHLNIATWFMINIYRLISAIFYLPNNIKSYKEIIGVFTTGKGGRVSLRLLDRNGLELFVPVSTRAFFI